MKFTFVKLFLLGLTLVGIIDAGYLTHYHYQNIIPPCTNQFLLTDCGSVLRSAYSEVLGIPLALLGLIHYSLLFLMLVGAFVSKHKLIKLFVLIQSTIGFVSSLYFVYLQLFVIHALCIYCMLSALISTLIFILCQLVFYRERKFLAVLSFGWAYRHILKQIFFLVEADKIHEFMIRFGEALGNLPVVKKAAAYSFSEKTPQLFQQINGITFAHPVGLAAGFDYEARLTQTLDPWGFGFQTVGTITRFPYGGNPPPLLGRLPKSKSLMVNKGFKNEGAKASIEKLTGLTFEIPVGVSIGRTNTRKLVTQKQSVKDILETFTLFEKSKVQHNYYELNISCPNLLGNISFYPPKNLRELLTEIDRLHLKRPLYVKMPIEKSDREVREMLDVIVKHSLQGVIFGNLQKDRKHPTLVKAEVARFPNGNFSGKPTYERSNELIKLAYRHYHERLTIIGCGGIFSGRDAYEKIGLGASLVQLITGIIFEGPQLVSAINLELEELLQQNGFKRISEAVGSRNENN